jgi:hypothetical protein
MSIIVWDSVAWYLAFSVFTFYQKLHLRNFRGASRAFETILGISGLLGSLAGISYLIYYGWHISWWGALAIFSMSIVLMLICRLLEKIMEPLFISVTGFLAWPVCAYLMYANLYPKNI